MSRINYLFFIHFLLILMNFTSCNEKKSVSSFKPNFKATELSYMGTAKRSIQLKLYQKNNFFNQESDIIAEIKTPSYFKGDVAFKWKYSSDIEIVSGEIKGLVQASEDHNSFTFKIKVKNFKTEQQKFIRFEASSLNSIHNIYTDGIVTSHIDRSFEDTVQKVEKYNADK